MIFRNASFQLIGLFLELLTIIILCFVAIHLQKKFTEKGRVEFRTFNSANINGILVYKHASSGSVYFKIKSDTNKYMFLPRSNPNHPLNLRFYSLAEIGDSIVKPPYSDTLFLFPSYQKVYKYTFRKLVD